MEDVLIGNYKDVDYMIAETNPSAGVQKRRKYVVIAPDPERIRPKYSTV